MPPGFRMTIGPDLRDVARVGAAFAAFAAELGLPAPIRRSTSVALEELLSNTVRHGYAGRAGVAITIEVALGGGRLTVTVTDDGRPFDPLSVAAPDTGAGVGDRPIGGLGIHLVRHLMDEVTYQRQTDRNVVFLAKRLGEGEAMEITTRARDGVAIVGVAGKLDSNTSPQAQQAFDAVLASGGTKLVVDFTGLDYISSAGLRVLLGTAKRLGGAGAAGGLRLFGLNETVREVFDISGFSSILSVFATEADALKGL